MPTKPAQTISGAITLSLVQAGMHADKQLSHRLNDTHTHRHTHRHTNTHALSPATCTLHPPSPGVKQSYLWVTGS